MNNKCLIGRGATTAGSQLHWFQSLKDIRNSKTSCDKLLTKNNGDGQTRYVKRYMTDRRFSMIEGSLGRSYVLRHPCTV